MPFCPADGNARCLSQLDSGEQSPALPLLRLVRPFPWASLGSALSFALICSQAVVTPFCSRHASGWRRRRRPRSVSPMSEWRPRWTSAMRPLRSVRPAFVRPEAVRVRCHPFCHETLPHSRRAQGASTRGTSSRSGGAFTWRQGASPTARASSFPAGRSSSPRSRRGPCPHPNPSAHAPPRRGSARPVSSCADHFSASSSRWRARPQVDPPPPGAGPSYRLTFKSVGAGLAVASYSQVAFGFVYDDKVRAASVMNSVPAQR